MVQANVRGDWIYSLHQEERCRDQANTEGHLAKTFLKFDMTIASGSAGRRHLNIRRQARAGDRWRSAHRPALPRGSWSTS